MATSMKRVNPKTPKPLKLRFILFYLMEFDFSVQAVANDYRRALKVDDSLDGGMFLEIKGEDLAKHRLPWQIKAQLMRIIDNMGQASSVVSNRYSNNHLGIAIVQASYVVRQTAEQLPHLDYEV